MMFRCNSTVVIQMVGLFDAVGVDIQFRGCKEVLSYLQSC